MDVQDDVVLEVNVGRIGTVWTKTNVYLNYLFNFINIFNNINDNDHYPLVGVFYSWKHPFHDHLQTVNYIYRNVFPKHFYFFVVNNNIHFFRNYLKNFQTSVEKDSFVDFHTYDIVVHDDDRYLLPDRIFHPPDNDFYVILEVGTIIVVPVLNN